MIPIGDAHGLVVLRDAPAEAWLVFSRPRLVVCTAAVGEVAAKLRLVESLVHEQGLHAAGFLAYEASPGFDRAFRVRAAEKVSGGFPLMWFGLYDRARVLDRLPRPALAAESLKWRASVSKQAYLRCLREIREHLRLGDAYQVNYTFRLHARFRTDPWEYFLSVCGFKPAPHAAYIGLEDWAACCFSPELFFSVDGKVVLSRPMKGTRPRGMTLAEDRLLAEHLGRSAKDRAENVMIVDMVRNDLGRVARPGSVEPVELFSVEKHATVWQMTSTVAAHTDRPLPEIFHALFPPASVTGAPKAAATGIIADLETSPRRIYTGSIGHFGPGRRAAFNVAIRTVLVDKRRGLAEYGVGGGIVWESDEQGEYEECRTKARVLVHRVPEFELLETMLWSPGRGILLLSRHLAKLAASAEYFDFCLDLQAVRDALACLERALGHEPRVIRLLLSEDGRARIEDLPAPAAAGRALRAGLAAAAVDSGDPFLYHKTTHRLVYEQALAAKPGWDDVILYNERGEVTESTRANVLARLDKTLYTPPVACGLLNGTMRAELLQRKAIVERILRPEDLRAAEAVFLVNSVRGIQPVECAWDEV